MVSLLTSIRPGSLRLLYSVPLPWLAAHKSLSSRVPTITSTTWTRTFRQSGFRRSSNFKMSINGLKPGSEDEKELSSTFQALGLGSVPSMPSLHPHINPVDIYRAHLVEKLAPLTGAQPEHILQAISWTQTLDHGDLSLPVPALRLKGKKPDELAKDIADRVRPQARRQLKCLSH